LHFETGIRLDHAAPDGSHKIHAARKPTVQISHMTGMGIFPAPLALTNFLQKFVPAM
jgi:hypothetical protein